MYKFIGNHYPNITYTDQKFLVMQLSVLASYLTNCLIISNASDDGLSLSTSVEVNKQISEVILTPGNNAIYL